MKIKSEIVRFPGLRGVEHFFVQLRLLPHHRLFVLFALLAVVSRVVFMLYTERVWEDALIALTSARNVWEGFGLTHHASEPFVQCFTSVLGELIMVAGEAFRQGLLAMQLVSIFASVVTIYFAYQIGVSLSFNWTAHTLVLSYLAFDHLQIFFGMSGMETQIATALLLANAYFYLSSQWTKLGIALGFVILARPEFVLWAVIIGVALVVWHREAINRVVIPAVFIVLPWLIFAWVYYGSLTPHTVMVKSIVYDRHPFASIGQILQFCLDWWKHVAPFRQYWAVSEAPLQDWVLKCVVLGVVSFSLFGAYRVLIINRRVWAIIVLVAGFFVYRTVTANGPYTMWYLPPFMALFFLLVGSGVTFAAKKAKVATLVVSLLLTISYVAPLIFVLPLDKKMQEEIEIGVRTKVGRHLNELMTSSDTAVLEPLGYIGWQARNKTIYDYPGLGSPIALEALKTKPGTGLGGMMELLAPTFAVLRPDVANDINIYLPKTAALYETVSHIKLEKPINLTNWGLSYLLIDNDFIILKRKKISSIDATMDISRTS